MTHTCRQCGASCQGLRVRPSNAERPRLEEHARALGIDRPLAGAFIRQNWGQCVFWDQGCRIHATFGASEKPAVCRQFPVLDTEIDPACFHPGEQRWVDPARFPWGDLEHGRQTVQRLRALPLVAILERPTLGTLTRDLLRGLETAEPRVPTPDEIERLEPRAHTLVTHGLAPADDRSSLVVGGAQLILGSRRPIGAGFAAWARLLRTGVV